MGASAPYLSLVVAARNDDHGGNMLGRMRCMIDSWIEQAEQLELTSEIVVVEWNPPLDRPRLKQSLTWPAAPKHCKVRIVEVPPAIHARFKHSASIPLHQMIAKNTGIRRALGEFVLATNLDIIFSSDLVSFLGERRLEKNVMYRMDRHDVARDAPSCRTVKELLDYCQRHTKRVFTREGDFSLGENGIRLPEQSDIVSLDAGVRFGTGWSQLECSGPDRYRWIEEEAELFFDRTAEGASLLMDVDVGPSGGSGPVEIEVFDGLGLRLATGSLTAHSQVQLQIPEGTGISRIKFVVHGENLPIARHLRMANLRVLELRLEPGAGTSGEPIDKWQLDIRPVGPAFRWDTSFYASSPFARQIRNAAYLHTNACGDFTLLSRDDWFALRGYPELPIWPMHLDAILCYSAHHAGIRESILKDSMRIYHVEHTTGAGWTPEGEKARLARLASRGVSELSYATVVEWVDLMRRYDAPAIFTRDDWGLSKISLAEESVWS
jgi:hypothetical protein